MIFMPLTGNSPVMRSPPVSFKIGIGIGIGIGIENNRWAKTMELTPIPIGSELSIRIEKT
jgi:hypothetical protein